jgi:hypothetical protein
MLPDLCTACLTPEEAAIDRQYASAFESLRVELQADRAERVLLAVLQGLAANPPINIDACRADLYAERALELARAVAATAFPDEPEDDAARTASVLVRP